MDISLEHFKEEWMKDILQDNPGSLEKGRRFTLKLFSQWLELGEDAEIYQCDGAYDGGIDLAYYESSNNEDDNNGTTWYFVQSKYGTSFQGNETIISETNKLIETMCGFNKTISPVAQNVVEQFSNFLSTMTEKDRIEIVFVTSFCLNDVEKRAISDVESIARARFGNNVSVSSVSIESIYNRLDDSSFVKYQVPMIANLVVSGDELLVGSIKLNNLYQFMKSYRDVTNDLELLYQRNVRKYLGGRKKVNKGITNTLETTPERFGIYNNGITIVVDDFIIDETDKYILVNPYVVNGCQTTRTVWDVLYKKLENIGSGRNEELEFWKNKLSKGVVITKVVKLGSNGEELLNNTTKYTNSQNAISAKDFIALEKNFQEWSVEMQNRYNIFLEIQRGAWDSKKTQMSLQPNRPDLKFDDYITAIDALKVYAAGWLQMPGTSFATTPPFAPGGSIFKSVIEDESFGVEELYAAYLLRKVTTKNYFGKNSTIPSLGKGRYLFYLVLLELLKECMRGTRYDSNSKSDITKCVVEIFGGHYINESSKLYNHALCIIEKYFDATRTESLYNETTFKGDINAFLKNAGLGKMEVNRKLYDLIAVENYIMRETKDLSLINSVILNM